jgi:hypothetical protein
LRETLVFKNQSINYRHGTNCLRSQKTIIGKFSNKTNFDHLSLRDTGRPSVYRVISKLLETNNESVY